MLISNLTIIAFYFSCAVFVSVIDHEWSEDADNPKAYWRYLLVNIVTWWINVLILTGRFVRFIKRQTRRNK